jgi:predicted glycoside hydrolase/deacetylase ChbG (UPF0249 family)
MFFRPLVTPDYCLVCQPQYRGRLERLAEGLKLALESIPPGVYELACHPGLREPASYGDLYWRERRELELSILTDPAFRAVIEQHNIELINYPQLVVAGCAAATTLGVSR